MTRLPRALASVAAGAVAVATLSLAPAPAVADQMGKPATYTKADSGETVKVASGDRIRVVLKAASGTGYSWRAVRPSSDAFTIVSRQEKSTNPGVPGGGVKVIFTLQAAAKGTGLFKAELRRPFGKKRVARRFSLTLKVG